MSDQERKATLKQWRDSDQVSGDTDALREGLASKKNNALDAAAKTLGRSPVSLL